MGYDRDKEYQKMYYKDKIIVDSIPNPNDAPSLWYNWYILLKNRLGKKKAALLFTELYSRSNYKMNVSYNSKLVDLMKGEGIDLGDSNWYLRFKQSTGISDIFLDAKNIIINTIAIGALAGGLVLLFKQLSKK